jgi:hypothetical protein
MCRDERTLIQPQKAASEGQVKLAFPATVLDVRRVSAQNTA